MKLSRRGFSGAASLLALDAMTGLSRAETMMSKLPFAADAPVSVTTVCIKARDVNNVADYYKDAVGLAEVARRPGAIVLGAGGLPPAVTAEEAIGDLPQRRAPGLSPALRGCLDWSAMDTIGRTCPGRWDRRVATRCAWRLGRWLTNLMPRRAK